MRVMNVKFVGRIIMTVLFLYSSVLERTQMMPL